MTPIQLVFRLRDSIKDIVKDYRMEESDGAHEMRPPNVWAQYLPDKLYDDAVDPADYPFVLVMLGGGAGNSEDYATCDVAMFVGGYDDGQPLEPGAVRDNQGWLVPAEMCWRIITTLIANPVLGSFRLKTENLSWELPEQEQSSPLWFGVIHTTWAIPIPKPNYNLGNMDFYSELPFSPAITDTIET